MNRFYPITLAILAALFVAGLAVPALADRPFTNEQSVVDTGYTAGEDILAADISLGEDYPTVALPLQLENHTGSAVVLNVVKTQVGGVTLPAAALNAGNSIPTGTVWTGSYMATRTDSGGNVLTYNFTVTGGSGTLAFTTARVEDGGM